MSSTMRKLPVYYEVVLVSSDLRGSLWADPVLFSNLVFLIDQEIFMLNFKPTIFTFATVMIHKIYPSSTWRVFVYLELNACRSIKIIINLKQDNVL